MNVRVPGALHHYTQRSRVQAEGATLGELFDDLERQFPGLAFRVVDERRQLRPNMRVFVSGRGVRDLAHPLRPDDEVALVLALSGG